MLNKALKIFTNSSFVLLGFALLNTSGIAQALTLNLVEGIDDPLTELPSALLKTNSGISILPSSVNFQGIIGDGINPNTAQSATYTDFNLAGINLVNGIHLTTGTANLPSSNLVDDFNNALLQPNSGSNASLSDLAFVNGINNTIQDANTLSFSFSTDLQFNAVKAELVFASDEYPFQVITDIFGFFVDGINYAVFPNGDLIGNNVFSDFIDNPVGGGVYPTEYNGFTQKLVVIGLLNPSLTTHTIEIAIGDISDDLYQSGVFIGGLEAVETDGAGGISGSETTPESGTMVGLLALGVLGGASKLRRA